MLSQHPLFAVVALLSYLEKYGKVLINEPEYQNIQDKLQDREFLRGLVRLAALLHDIGKPPPQGHVERSCDFIKSLKQELGDDVTQALSSIVARHHYGIDYQNKPRNVLEWIVAFADKASAGSRGFIPKDEPDKFKRIIEFFMNLNPGYDLGKQRLNLIQQVLSGTETFEEQDDVEKFLLGFLSKNPERVYMINKALIEAEKKILESGDFTADKETRLLALLHLDVPSIQSYITRGRSLAVSVGYSLMIDAFIHKIAKIIEEEIGKEVILSKEGGSLLALVPVGYSDKLAKKIKSQISEANYIRFTYYEMPIKFGEAFLGPEEYWSYWTSQKADVLKRDSMRTFGTLVSKLIFESSVRAKSVLEEDHQEKKIQNVCLECKTNERINGSELCEACFKAKEWYKNFRNLVVKEGVSREFEILKELRSVKLVEDLRREAKAQIEIPETLDEWSGQRGLPSQQKEYIAYVTADGDNFGTMKSSASTITHYLSIVTTLTDMIYFPMLYSLKKIAEQKTQIKFVPCYIGGDDVLIIIPAKHLKEFLINMESAIKNMLAYEARGGDEDLRKLRKGFLYKRLGVSAGLYITKDVKYPVFLAIENAKALEGVSKKYAKSESKEHEKSEQDLAPHFTFTIADEKTFSFVQKAKDDYKLTLNGSELAELKNDMDKLSASKLTANKSRNTSGLTKDETSMSLRFLITLLETIMTFMPS
ncbi:hypothetical protein B9Q01_10265 [Candidatus Marsarchaeota G1 archaeon OSP_D]|uniref:HD domain-containing protein n=1 Tax=Candidatus Marsarchaeota G1 archaeon OSP_D TaxID=1978155 RepID=A0A2R6A626_9ARCH|nr:MAG: hypothetical protein B9Q01_10265 [Candidatus Marsarchaeota G1 archaeon OSP_D]